MGSYISNSATRWTGYHAIAILFILTTVVSYQLYGLNKQLNDENEKAAGMVLSVLNEFLVQFPIVIGSPELQAVLKAVQQKNAGIVHISIVNPTLTIIADTDPDHVNTISVQTGLLEVINKNISEKLYYAIGDRNIYRQSRPLIGQYDPVRKSNVIGAVSVDIDLTSTEIRFNEMLGWTLVISLVLTLSYSFGHFYFINRLHLRPLHLLADSVIKISNGDYYSDLGKATYPELSTVLRVIDHMRIKWVNILHKLHSEMQERTTIENDIQEAHSKLKEYTQKIQEKESEASIIAELSQTLQACVSLDEVNQILHKFCEKLFNSFSGAIYLYREVEHQLVRTVIWGAASALRSTICIEDCLAFRTNRPFAVELNQSSIICQHVSDADLPNQTKSKMKYSLCVPMVAQGKILGLFFLYNRQPGSDQTDHDTVLGKAVIVAEYVSLITANLNFRNALRQEAIRDPLTYLFNRRYMLETMERELRRAERANGHLGIIMADIDYFKRVNDTYGHECGDLVLKEVANIFKTRLRAEDVPTRLGGEEFLLILPGASLEDSVRRAETLRLAVKEQHLMYHGQELGIITISIGVSAFPDIGATAQVLVETADAALYRAKQGGGDRVETGKVSL